MMMITDQGILHSEIKIPDPEIGCDHYYYTRARMTKTRRICRICSIFTILHHARQ